MGTVSRFRLCMLMCFRTLPVIEATVPAGMVKDAHGNCVTPAVSVVIIDLCLNVAGVQTTVPAGLVRDAHGNCVAPAHGPGTTPVHGTVTHELPFAACRSGSRHCSATGCLQPARRFLARHSTRAPRKRANDGAAERPPRRVSQSDSVSPA